MEETNQGYSEAVSAGTHLVAALASVAALILLVSQAVQEATTWHVVGFSVFGTSLIMLYSASATYHLTPKTPKRKVFFRRLDHIMIYLLIAGTYTPICITILRGPWGWSILGVVWGLALAGFLFKMVWLQAPRWLSTTLYVVMGWTALAAIVPLWSLLGPSGVAWLIGGGVFYTVGAAAYATKWPTISARHFTFHELFHILVMAGSVCHVVVMQAYVLPG
jgi:hemolysin III